MAGADDSLAAQGGYRLVRLPQRSDARGRLGYAQEGDEVPFVIRRAFYLYDIPAGATRGGHAHLAQHQFLIMLRGSCEVAIEHAAGRATVRLDSPLIGLYLPPLHWIELREFRDDPLCLVLTSDLYDEGDYVRDHEQFRRLAATKTS